MLDQSVPDPLNAKQSIDAALAEIEGIIVGKPQQIRLAVCCLLASGHCLIEDLPGLGKTTLAQSIAKVFGLDFNRIQFTSDLLPADILGVSIFDPNQQSFSFHPGPIFSHCVLADEINRATPKSQSALLEAMEERQITVEGETRKLHEPFFVIGTQNPIDQAGTFPLPESQLDRFMMKINLGYPDPDSERRLLKGTSRDQLLLEIPQVIDKEQLLDIQRQAEQVHVSEALLDYLQALLAITRQNDRFIYGLSPRAALALLKSAKAWAIMENRNFVEPGDIKAIFSAVSAHRLTPAQTHSSQVDTMLEQILQETPIP
jgi:MoxR-like ATPase